jgi:hypothetical protein
MNLSRVIAISALTIVSFIAGCGGDSGSGTSMISKGTIDGFGSIFVNGVAYETDRADIYLNGISSTDNDLQIGMVVTVGGNVHDNGLTGTASDINFDADVEGPVSSIAPGPNGDTLALIIFGVEVLVERVGTVIEGTGFGSLAIGDFVEVSGFVDERLRLRATRVEKKFDFQSGSGKAKLSGYVDTLTATEFILGDVAVDHSNADLSGSPGGELGAGMWVEVQGHFDNERITAERIVMAVGSRIRDNVNEGDRISIEGTIFCRATCNTHFVVDEFQVDAASATLLPTDLILQDGLIVQVEGIWSGHELRAQKILARRSKR